MTNMNSTKKDRDTEKSQRDEHIAENYKIKKKLSSNLFVDLT